jgi:hypothetical protein
VLVRQHHQRRPDAQLGMADPATGLLETKHFSSAERPVVEVDGGNCVVQVQIDEYLVNALTLE